MKNTLKNPLKKRNNSLLIGAVAAGAALAGGISWLLFTPGGKAFTGRLAARMKDQAEEFTASVLSEQTGVSKYITKPAAEAVIE